MSSKQFVIIVALLLTSSASYSQNWQACDSLTINCCTHNTAGPNTVVLEVENASSVLFDYPGFIIFDTNMDTIAVETVNYFGISANFQQHVMNLVAPMQLPFTGTLNLYTLFYANLACSWPITLPDTLTGLFAGQDVAGLSIYPNPLPINAELNIEGYNQNAGPITIIITDTQGRNVKSIWMDAMQPINVNELESGVYFMNIVYNQNSQVLKFMKL